MSIYKISLSDAQADKLADWLSRTTGKVDSRIADEIRAQIPKPPDPIEDLVQEFANRDWPVGDADDARLRYFITPGRLREFAAAVLRVGIGEPVGESHVAAALKDLRVGHQIRISGHGVWRVISLNTEPGSIGLRQPGES